MTRAPGPKGSLIWGSLAEFQADSLGFLQDAVRDHGDIVRLRFGPVTAHLINHPEYIEHVLSRNAANYDKATRSAKRIAATTGDSLLSASQTSWKRHRTLIQPAFQPSAFANIEPEIDRHLAQIFARWRKLDSIDIVDEMMNLVIAVAIRLLFSADVDPRQIDEPLRIILADTWRRIEAPLDVSLFSARLHRRAFREAVAQIDALVLDLIGKRRAAGGGPDDVLSRLLTAHQPNDEIRLSDTELRDAAVTLLLAGHETTANALSWAFIRAAGRFEDAEPAHIFAEALRLYPSIWVIERRAIQADEIGGYRIPRASPVLISPYLLHRKPDFWPDPERFDPARFAQTQPRARDGYIPFGLGQHRCVGLYLANKMAAHIIGAVFAQFALELVPGQTLQTTPGITLRHRAAVRMTLRQRQ